MKQSHKRVLFIHIQFYDYDQRIKDKMHELGYTLDSFCEDPKVGRFDKILQKWDPQFIMKKSTKQQTEFIETLSKTAIQYDYIFVLKGEKISRKFLMDLKKLNPKAKFILYMWDDVDRVSNFFEMNDMYDEIYSFDINDAKKYGLKFLPLFFCEQFRNDGSIVKNTDVFFSGWDHSSRRQLLERIIPVLMENNMRYYFHIYSGRWKVLKQKIKQMNFKKEPSYIKYNTLSLKQNAELTLNSKILIDIQHPTQSGLTMRTLEALAAKSKLITTNTDVTKYDFYKPNNILIIDRENPIIDLEFLKTSYENVPEEIVEKYSLSNWIKTMLDK